MAVYELLEKAEFLSLQRNTLVFITLTEKYMTPHSYYGIAIEEGNRRSRFIIIVPQDIFNRVFRAGFVVMDFMKNNQKTTKKFLW